MTSDEGIALEDCGGTGRCRRGHFEPVDVSVTNTSKSLLSIPANESYA
jgi:hypothetical protein